MLGEHANSKGRGFSRWRIAWLAPLAALALAGLFIPDFHAEGGGRADLPLHAVLEAQVGLACVVMAVLLVFLGTPKDGARRGANMVLASSLVVSGVLDSFHAALAPGEAFVWLRTIATCGGGLVAASLVLPWRRRIPSALPIFAGVAALAVGALSTAFPACLPAMLDHGAFTPLAVALNVAGGLGYIVGAMCLLRDGERGRFPILLVATLLLFGAAGLLFATSALWHADWWWWHVVRYVGSLVLLAQFALNAKGLQAQLAADRDTLEVRVNERTAEIEAANASLRRTAGELDAAKRHAESANQAKGAFLAAMSHEIRTPMNAVLNMISTVLDSPLGAEQKEYLRVADSSARHLLSVINDILDFSKIESGKLETEDIPFSLHGLLEGVCDLFRTKVAESHVELVLDLAPGTPDGVRGDPTRLRQILVNLIGNAFKFTARGQVVLHASADGGRLRLAVADSGIGIAPEHQGRLFQPFMQADAATTRRFGGTGLGLTISRRLAELMGGGVTLSSVLGEGSVFTVDLPLHPDGAGDRGELRLPLPLQGRVVLLIEDNAATREAVRVMLERHGLACVSFPAVEPALEWLKSPAAGELGAAFVDWLLPGGGMDGLAGIGELRRVRAGLPCFLVSAFADRAAQDQAHAAGAAAFIPKPVTWVATHAALQAALAPKEEPAPPPPVAATAAFPGTLALLAEDNPQNQLVAKVLLKKMGITVEVAENGRIALDKAQAEPGKYQVILMDMQMPEMDGLEATRQIRAAGERIPALKGIPIVAMTANAMKSDLDACLAAGMDGFVTKPIDKAALAAALAKVLPSPS